MSNGKNGKKMAKKKSKNESTATGEMENIQKMHKLIGADVVKAVQASRNL